MNSLNIFYFGPCCVGSTEKIRSFQGPYVIATGGRVKINSKFFRRTVTSGLMNSYVRTDEQLRQD